MTPPYAIIADLEERVDAGVLIQLADPAMAGTRDDAIVQRALDQANAIVQGYVASAYAPIAPPFPILLTDAACDIALARLYRHQTPPEAVEKRQTGAIAILRDIQRGTIKLDGGAAEPLVRRDGILVSASDRLFTRDSMAGF